ncbi:MAG: NfeD family protein [Anaerorhabdus sp.]
MFYFWIFVLVAAVILEFATQTTLVSLWFAVGAAISLLANYIGFNTMWQIIIFLFTSISCILIFRPILRKYTNLNFIPTNADRVISQHTRLLTPICEGQLGTVNISGVIWNAASIHGDIEKDSLVEVCAIEGSKVIVKKI